MDKDKVESKWICKLVRAKPQQCYYNAFRVIMEVPEYAEADYVEGMISSGGLLIEHGWIEKDEAIIDPTLPLGDQVYFSGLRFIGRMGLAKAIKIPKPRHTREDFPIFYRFGWGGIDSPEFRAACVAAYRHAGMEGLARQYEEYESPLTTAS